MNALIADDNPLRHECFRVLEALGWTVHHAGTVEAAQAFLENETYQLVALDHDFTATDCMTLPEEATGRGLAKKVAGLAVKPPLVIVHTANVAARAIMVKTLADAGIRVCVMPLSNVFLQ